MCHNDTFNKNNYIERALELRSFNGVKPKISAKMKSHIWKILNASVLLFRLISSEFYKHEYLMIFMNFAEFNGDISAVIFKYIRARFVVGHYLSLLYLEREKKRTGNKSDCKISTVAVYVRPFLRCC